ncbi:hypothetical protein MMA231_03711 (plasmid) [Asticcacaulis sp. MM231]
MSGALTATFSDLRRRAQALSRSTPGFEQYVHWLSPQLNKQPGGGVRMAARASDHISLQKRLEYELGYHAPHDLAQDAS